MEENKTLLEEYVEYHRILWRGIANYILNNGIKNKTMDDVKGLFIDIMREDFNIKSYPRNYCFLCEYDKIVSIMVYVLSYCNFCPLKSEKKDFCLDGIYRDFAMAFWDMNIKKAYKLALQIAELPIVNRSGEEVEKQFRSQENQAL